ncbi:hypothetical protein FA13DRAFT_1744672 [Coprinellus micaceus]|uniref:Uncharacterized protein n=1 Tax=Coprinellus micaceus TaxID=71717 RepID=A0A4Y7SC09_COPMI|nr:hypothetical protein FA13DRAFT_1744672 [Coprinellus micaceus]
MWTGSDPTCITGVIGWVHGKYTLNANVQDPCAAVSNFIEKLQRRPNTTRAGVSSTTPSAGPKLHLFQFDGSPVAPQFLVSKNPFHAPHPPERVGGEEVEDLERERVWLPTAVRALFIAVLGAAGLVVLTAASMMI